eukprot:s283_g19.t1
MAVPQSSELVVRLVILLGYPAIRSGCQRRCCLVAQLSQLIRSVPTFHFQVTESRRRLPKGIVVKMSCKSRDVLTSSGTLWLSNVAMEYHPF